MQSSQELWYVQLPDGDVHRVTLDQLDDAFQRGFVNANTKVLPSNATRWSRLGQLANLDDDVAPAYSQRPVSLDLSEVQLRPVRSGRRWLGALLALALFGAPGVLAAKRSDLVKPYLTRLHLQLPGSWGGAARMPAAAPVPPPTPVAAPLPPVTAIAASPPPAPPAPSPTTAPVPPRAASEHAPAKSAPVDRAKPHHKPGARAGAQGISGHGVKPSSPNFTTGGSKFDPLNSSI